MQNMEEIKTQQRLSFESKDADLEKHIFDGAEMENGCSWKNWTTRRIDWSKTFHSTMKILQIGYVTWQGTAQNLCGFFNGVQKISPIRKV